jgi:peptidyl-prolyl cis-trans isomerase SurA
MFNKLTLRLMVWLLFITLTSTICHAQQTGGSSTTENEAWQQAYNIYEQLLAGADFELLANKLSDDPVSALRGGNLGFAKQGQMVKPFEKVALSLKPGEISKPVKTEFGYHIIQMIQRRGKEYNCRHILVR